jgi:hypothetical protein
MSDAELKRLVRTIVSADDAAVFALLERKPGLAKAHFEDGATRQMAKPYHIDKIGHYVYSGDTALHIAAASYREEIEYRSWWLGLTRSESTTGADRRIASGAHYQTNLIRPVMEWSGRAPCLPA